MAQDKRPQPPKDRFELRQKKGGWRWRRVCGTHKGKPLITHASTEDYKRIKDCVKNLQPVYTGLVSITGRHLPVFCVDCDPKIKQSSKIAWIAPHLIKTVTK